MKPLHLAIVVVLVGVIALLWMRVARAHGPYTDWRIPTTGGSCCNNADCRPTRARQDDDGRWEAWDGARWLSVPPLAVLSMPSPDGRSHLCESGGAVFCFVPAPAMR